MSAQTLLSGGDKWFSYSGEIFGDVSAPATINMILIPNTGLRDSYVFIEPYYGVPVSTANASAPGIEVKIDDVTVIKNQANRQNNDMSHNTFRIFVPRQSKLEVISLNTAANNTQIRGCNLIGYYL